MDKICNIAIVLAFLIAVVAAFVAIPNVTAMLLVLGGIGGLNSADKPEYRVRIYGAAIVLMLGAHLLTDIPAIGEYLAAIFSSVATAFVGVSVVAITLAIAVQVKNDGGRDGFCGFVFLLDLVNVFFLALRVIQWEFPLNYANSHYLYWFHY